VALSRRVQRGLAAGIFAGGLFVLLLIAIGPPARAPDTLARGDAWNDELRTPRRVIAHRIDQRAVKAEHSVEGWKSVQKLELTPESDEGKLLAKLFFRGKLATVGRPDLNCAFTPDFGLEFISASGRRSALFSFDCMQVQGDSGIKGFDPVELATFASRLFPEDAVYERVKNGERAHPPPP
jgi:hypothetical protein